MESMYSLVDCMEEGTQYSGVFWMEYEMGTMLHNTLIYLDSAPPRLEIEILCTAKSRDRDIKQ